jgi:GNAT superfamily N-acetyltransferase
MEWVRGEYTLTTDPARVDIDALHEFLARSYWAADIPRELVARSVEHSLNFTLLHENRQVGFARVVTDYATYAYVGDVYVLEAHRGRGLSRWMMETMIAHPELQGFRRWSLLTRDAHGLYARVGFTPLAAPERWMERRPLTAYAAPEKD